MDATGSILSPVADLALAAIMFVLSGGFFTKLLAAGLYGVER